MDKKTKIIIGVVVATIVVGAFALSQSSSFKQGVENGATKVLEQNK